MPEPAPRGPYLPGARCPSPVFTPGQDSPSLGSRAPSRKTRVQKLRLTLALRKPEVCLVSCAILERNDDSGAASPSPPLLFLPRQWETQPPHSSLTPAWAGPGPAETHECSHAAGCIPIHTEPAAAREATLPCPARPHAASATSKSPLCHLQGPRGQRIPAGAQATWPEGTGCSPASLRPQCQPCPGPHPHHRGSCSTRTPVSAAFDAQGGHTLSLPHQHRLWNLLHVFPTAAGPAL